jgi:hypothetical protein
MPPVPSARSRYGLYPAIDATPVNYRSPDPAMALFPDRKQLNHMQTQTIHRSNPLPKLLVAIATVSLSPLPCVLAETAAPEEPDRGAILLNMRARYEYGDQAGVDSAEAFTVRTRLGYESPDFSGFKLLAELESTVAVTGMSGYNGYPGSPQGTPGKTVIADPRNLELNRAQVAWADEGIGVVAGRQRIILNNARFIGNVGWRQNEATFDAGKIRLAISPETSFTYAYLDRVNRIFGEKADARNQRYWELDGHLLHFESSALKVGKVGAYAYLLEVESSGAEGASSNTFGLFLDSRRECGEKCTLTGYAEYARQSANSGNTSDFDLDYLHLTVGAKLGKGNLGAGYEILEGNGVRGFSTPLATGHKFNGWADEFLGTPAAGLKDLYFWAGAALPGGFSVKGMGHFFDAEIGGIDYGDEVDFLISRKFDKKWSATLKFARYSASGKAAGALGRDRTRVSFQVDFAY